jgi:hypothetical protein
MKRAREICGRNVTTITVRQWYSAANRCSCRPSPLVVGGSGMKQRKLIPGCGVAQYWVSHGFLDPIGLDTTTMGAQPSSPS